MSRINPARVAALHLATREVKGRWNDYLNSALSAIALLAPLIRRGTLEKSKSAAHSMVWTIAQCVSLGEKDKDKDDLKVYSATEIAEYQDRLDSYVLQALIDFGVLERVLSTLDSIQASDEPLFLPEQWGSIRAWWVLYLNTAPAYPI